MKVSSVFTEQGRRIFDYDELRAACGQFAKEHEIGEGGFGLVYRGFVDGCGSVAVKVVSHDNQQGFPELRNEVNHLSVVRHPNFVPVLGVCLDPLALVYPRMRCSVAHRLESAVLMKIFSTASAVSAASFYIFNSFDGFIGSSVSSAAVVRAVSLS